MEKETKPRKPFVEEVVQEFPAVGKYRIRLLRNPRKPRDGPALDIREYVKDVNFEGFTRRGIRLSERAHLDVLRDVLKEVLERAGFAGPTPGLLPVQ